MNALIKKVFRRSTLLVLALCGFFLSRLAVFAGEASPNYLTLTELVEIGDKSEVAYAFEVTENQDQANRFPIIEPLEPSPLVFPRVVASKDGSRYLSEYECTEATYVALGEAEPHFNAHNYGASLAIYRRAVEADPECYVLHSHIGDCLLGTGKPEDALSSYRRALSLNSLDFRTHWFVGDALFDLGQYRDAKEAYVRALALQPAYPPLLEFLKSQASLLRITVSNERYLAPAGARQGQDQIVVVAPEQQYWQLYGLCHAIWLGEPSHRERMTGKQEYSWTSTEATECLLILLQGYARFGPAEGGARDPIVERVARIHDRGLLEAFLYYEMGAQGVVTPILLAPEGLRVDMARYVSEFVVTDNESDSP